MSIKAVFWDSDNTLVDTGALHWRKHLHVLADLGIALHESDRPRIYTNNGQQNWQWLVQERGLQLAKDDYLSLIDGWYSRHITDVKMRSGIGVALELVAEAGLPQAVVSNGRRDSVMMALAVHHIPEKMVFVLCKEDYEGRKPDPAPYLAALARLNDQLSLSITPDECLVIEDDPKGVRSAIAAGMKVIHRLLDADQPCVPDATACVFEESAFLAALKAQLS